jgi:hypothetical protein
VPHLRRGLIATKVGHRAKHDPGLPKKASSFRVDVLVWTVSKKVTADTASGTCIVLDVSLTFLENPYALSHSDSDKFLVNFRASLFGSVVEISYVRLAKKTTERSFA